MPSMFTIEWIPVPWTFQWVTETPGYVSKTEQNKFTFIKKNAPAIWKEKPNENLNADLNRGRTKI